MIIRISCVGITMDFVDSLNITRLSVGLIVLLIGCVMDIKERKVKNRLWLISGGIASLLLVAYIAYESSSALAVLLTMTAIFYFYYFYSDLDFDKMPTGKSWLWPILGIATLGLYIWSVFHYEIPSTVKIFLLITFFLLAVNEITLLRQGKSSRMSWMILLVLCFITLALLSQYDITSIEKEVPITASGTGIDPSFMLITSIFLIITVIYSMYNSGIIMGGADAKALMFVSLLLPAYPVVSSLNINTFFFEILEEIPLQRFIFPFSMAMLINGAFLLLLYPVFFLILNLIRKDWKFPKCLFGYRLDVTEFEKRFVWLLEIEKEGKRKMVLSPPREEKEEKAYLKALVDAGEKKIWVQPKIPFLIPMTIGYIAAIVFGNIIFLLIGLFQG